MSTGVAPILVDASGSNSIVIISGANDTLTPNEIEYDIYSFNNMNVLNNLIILL